MICQGKDQEPIYSVFSDFKTQPTTSSPHLDNLTDGVSANNSQRGPVIGLDRGLIDAEHPGPDLREKKTTPGVNSYPCRVGMVGHHGD